MAWTNPTATDFQNYFVRDFTYGDTTADVMDADINTALQDMMNNINQCLFTSQTIYTSAALNLAAHFLVLNLRAANQNLSGQFNFMQASKGAGAVSESFAIPQRILDNAELSMYCKTNYGAKYIMMVLPLLGGAVFTTYADANADGSGQYGK